MLAVDWAEKIFTKDIIKGSFAVLIYSIAGLRCPYCGKGID